MDIIPEAPIKVTGLPFEGYNAVTLYNSWVAIAVLLLFAWLGVRRLQLIPGRLQAAWELVAEFFDDLCTSALGKEHGRSYMPFVATLFLFVLVCNVMGCVPNVLWWLGWHGFYSPTQDLNTPLGLALLVFFVVHISAIRIKGFGRWLWSFYEPSFPADRIVTKLVGLAFFAGGAWLNYRLVLGYGRAAPAMALGGRIITGTLLAAFIINSVLVTHLAFRFGRVPNLPMAPLNVVGEMGKAISHPFRLFGNIFGGFVILTVVSHLILHIGLPPFLSAFFDVFIGLVQAFVFAMLALAYTALQIRD